MVADLQKTIHHHPKYLEHDVVYSKAPCSEDTLTCEVLDVPHLIVRVERIEAAALRIRDGVSTLWFEWLLHNVQGPPVPCIVRSFIIAIAPHKHSTMDLHAKLASHSARWYLWCQPH